MKPSIPEIDFLNCPFRFEINRELNFKLRKCSRPFSGFFLIEDNYKTRMVIVKQHQRGVVSLTYKQRLPHYYEL